MKIDPQRAAMLLTLARETIAQRLGGGPLTVTMPETDDMYSKRAATFVTLKIANSLRGCIGSLEPVTSLWQSVRENAINAAFHDHRFSPLTNEELAEVKIDISILTTPAGVNYEDAEDLIHQLRPNIDGVILQHRHRGATFLPQVWEQIPDPENFLTHLCRKAGLAGDCWMYEHPEIKVYQVQSFAEEKK